MHTGPLVLGLLTFAVSAGVCVLAAWLSARPAGAGAAAGALGLPGDAGLLALVCLVQAGGLGWLVFRLASARTRADAEVVARDRSLRHQAERTQALGNEARRAMDMVEHVDQVIFQVDTAARWRFLNRAWHTLTGLEVAATLGQPLADALHPDDRQEVQRLCAGLLRGDHEDCRLEVRFLTKGGASWWADVRARPIVEGGRPVAVTGTITDITARRHAQEEIERARTEAERASAAKSDFLRSMSHEMRTPLNGVLGLMELLAATRLDAQQARYVSIARASAAHLSSLIADILDVTRIEAGGLTLERHLFDLRQLLASSVETVAAAAAAKRLRVSRTVSDQVPTWVVGDPGRLRQVLVNLLANAVKFTARGDVRLEADADLDLQSRRATLRLAVRDTGVGIAADQLARLFEPFAPGEDASPRRLRGSGLGLTICKRLVDALGGTIDAHSVEQAGATFVVTLPIDVADAAMVAAQHEGETPMRVLAVLADTADRDTVGRLLQGWRFDAAVVSDGESAWDHVQATSGSRWQFAVVVIDAGAPGGADLGRRIGGLASPPGVVWVSAPDAGEAEPRQGVVARPIEGRVLFDAIMQAAVGTRPADPAAPAPAWDRPPRVLVAEDHDVNQLVVQQLLLGMGCHVDVAADGEQAVSAALAIGYDVIVMDAQMPGVDGLEATRRIRRATAEGRIARAPRIIALTAYASAEDRRRCLAAGMDAYLAKPVRGSVLLRTLQRLLGHDTADVAMEPTPDGQRDGSDWSTGGPPPDAEDIIDPAEVLLRCNQNGDLGARMLELFAASLPSELEKIEVAAHAGDVENLTRLTHKLRGAASTLAAARLAGAVHGVERFLKYGDDGPLADRLADVRHESALLLGAVPQAVRQLSRATPTSRA